MRSGKDKAPLPPRPQAEEREENSAEKVDCHPRERDDQLAPIGEPREGGSVQLRAERCKAEVLDGYAVVAHGGKMSQLVQRRGGQDRPATTVSGETMTASSMSSQKLAFTRTFGAKRSLRHRQWDRGILNR